MNKIDKKIKRALSGTSVLQRIYGNVATYIVYKNETFWFESYVNGTLIATECCDEETARFSLT